MSVTSIYLVPYRSQPDLHLKGSSGQFSVVERAITAREWPYDNGDDPSFYVKDKGGELTWGVCRQDVRNSIKPGSIVVFFSFTSVSPGTVQYRLSAVATVEGKVDRRQVYKDAHFREHCHLYLNVLIKPKNSGWEYDENDRERKAQHRDWLWRIAVHERLKKIEFDSKFWSIYKTRRFSDGDIELTKNYVIFSAEQDKTYIPMNPPEVAMASKGQHEQWSDLELRRLTVEKSPTREKRNYLRTKNPSNRNIHPEIRFDLPSEEATDWRKLLILELKKRS
jgi:hypothetical protein